jgi:hypothetical protein
VSHDLKLERSRSRLLYPVWPIRRGNIPARYLPAYRSHRRSEVNSSRADITARISSSALLSVGPMPSAGRPGGKAQPVSEHVIDLDVQHSGESPYVIVHNLDHGDSRLFMRGYPLESSI